MRDLICDVNYCTWTAKLRYGSKLQKRPTTVNAYVVWC